MRKIRPVVAKTPEALAEALGLSAAEAKEWRVQYALLQHLREIVRKDGITHADVAKRAGTSRTRVTAILNGNIEDVSSDLLIRILGSLGYRVTVSVRKTAKVA
jgi:transcriptional regulator with XRE-family HTH domain